MTQEEFKQFKSELEAMDEVEYQAMQKRESKTPSSDWMKFVQKVGDFKFYRNGLRVYKWELFASGCRAENYKEKLIKLAVKIA